jgi:endogenous inhibitor of DNA gyrase (YacG/DUF329 family)
MTDYHLDGNAIAGLLTEVFGNDMTSAERDCPACGNHSALGEQRAYIGAGVVMRCPGCDRPTVRIATLRDRYVVQVTGSVKLEVPRS